MPNIKMIDFWQLLPEVQEAMAKNYAETMADSTKHKSLKPYIEKYVKEKGYVVKNLNTNQVVNRLYREMVEYSILTPFLADTELEEININAWNDIAITDLSGNITKTKEHFHSPQHAIDIVKKLLHQSGMVIDDSTPMAQGHLPNNIRITALKDPLVDPDVGIAVSIRILHPQRVNYENLINYGTATQEMLEFLALCARYGISFVVAGATSSGKTTAMNAILNTIPDNKRIYTIETGARELHLVHKDEKGRIINNVVHTLSRPSEKKESNVDQAQLVVGSLRFNPDNIVVGEIRDAEAHDAVEASLTGHTVITSIHATAAQSAHMRMALLCQRKPNAPTFEQSMLEAAKAFPVVVYAHKLENNDRRIMDIAECVVDDSTGERTYRSLYKYTVTKNEAVGDDYIIEGYFSKVNVMSDNLRQQLLNFGCPNTRLKKFLAPTMSQNDEDYPEAPIAVHEELVNMMSPGLKTDKAAIENVQENTVQETIDAADAVENDKNDNAQVELQTNTYSEEEQETTKESIDESLSNSFGYDNDNDDFAGDNIEASFTEDEDEFISDTTSNKEEAVVEKTDVNPLPVLNVVKEEQPPVSEKVQPEIIKNPEPETNKKVNKIKAPSISEKEPVIPVVKSVPVITIAPEINTSAIEDKQEETSPSANIKGSNFDNKSNAATEEKFVVPVEDDEIDDVSKDFSEPENNVNKTKSFFSNIGKPKKEKKDKRNVQNNAPNKQQDATMGLFGRAFGGSKKRKDTPKEEPISEPQVVTDVVETPVVFEAQNDTPSVEQKISDSNLEEVVKPEITNIEQNDNEEQASVDVDNHSEEDIAPVTKNPEPVDFDTYKENISKYTAEDIQNMSFSEILQLLNKK